MAIKGIKKAIDYATKDTGPNNGDYNHKDYININIEDEGIAKMYKYLNEIQQIIELEKTSVTKTNFNKAKEEHDKSYKRLIKEK